MKFRYTLILAGAALMALASCNKESALQAKDSELEEIVFTAEDEMEASVATKATVVTTSNLTKIYMTATTGTAGNAAEASAFTSAEFNGTSGGDFTGGKYWPATSTSYHFYGSNVAHTFASGVCSVSPATNSTDIVCVYVASPTYKAKTALTFKHIYAQIGSCNISAPSGYTVTGLTVKVTPNIGGTYNIRTGNGKTDGTGWSSLVAGSETTIASAVGATTSNGLYLVPGSYTLTASYTLTKDAFSKSYTKTASVNLVGGKINNISATLPDAGDDISEITFTVSVTAWSSNAITATFS